MVAGGGFTNKGAEAMVLAVADVLQDRLPNLNIYVIAPFGEARAIEDAGLIPTGRGHPRSPVARFRSAIRTRHAYRTCRAFIDVGGYQFGDAWGTKRAGQKAELLSSLASRRVPIFLMPQAWGPFSSRGLSHTVRRIVDASTVCFVRDAASMRMMHDLFGAGNPKICFAHDIAWNFRGAASSVGERLLDQAGWKRDRCALTVAVTPNLRVYEKSEGTGAQSQYVRFLMQVTRHLCSMHNAQVVLIGHELSLAKTRVKDDRTLCSLLLDLLDGKWPVVHVDAEMSAADVKSVIGNCDLLVASRYHALISALSQSIPVAAAGWSHKYDELLKEVGLSENGLSIGTSVPQVSASLDRIIQRLSHSRTVIQSKLPGIKANAADAVETMVSGVEAAL